VSVQTGGDPPTYTTRYRFPPDDGRCGIGPKFEDEFGFGVPVDFSGFRDIPTPPEPLGYRCDGSLRLPPEENYE